MSSAEPPQASNQSPSGPEEPAAPAEETPEQEAGARSQSPSSSEQTTPPTEGAPQQDNGAGNQSPSSSEDAAPPAGNAPVQEAGVSNQSPSSSEEHASPAGKGPGPDDDKNQSSSSEQTAAAAGKTSDPGGKTQSSSSSVKPHHNKGKAPDPPPQGARGQSSSSSEQTAAAAGKTSELHDGASKQSSSSSGKTSRPKGKAPDPPPQEKNQSSSSEQTAAAAGKTPVQDNGGTGPSEKEDGAFSIILLGQTGTGKSASANTILSAGKHQWDKGQAFESKPSSMPVTTKCKEKIVAISGTTVRVVDTPDFFYEDEPIDEAQVEECKKYCQEGRCVVLLVIQLGRFTDGEKGILEKLEDKLGWKIRKNTIVLFTHGEDLTGTVETFIGERSDLKHIVEACSSRYHVFNNNNSKDTKQVTALLKKFRKESFLKSSPSSSQSQSHSQCCLL